MKPRVYAVVDTTTENVVDVYRLHPDHLIGHESMRIEPMVYQREAAAAFAPMAGALQRAGTELGMLVGTDLTVHVVPAIAKLNGRLARQSVALAEVTRLNAHYAELLNMHDGGMRLLFPTTESLMARLEALGHFKDLPPVTGAREAPAASDPPPPGGSGTPATR